MSELFSPFGTLQEFKIGSGRGGKFYSLPALENAGFPRIARMPVSLRLVLESVLRHCDGKRITEAQVSELARWEPHEKRTTEIPFVVARILLQDFTGVPLLVDLAAMRSAVSRWKHDPKIVEPLVPVELVVDHSVQVDFSGSGDALGKNMQMEFKRNRSRYEFLKWGMGAFEDFKVVPPGVGIVHQVNLETLARGLMEKDGVYYPDSLVGTDSHTTMINGLGIVAWGVGGIEAEAGMLGQPIYFLTPDVLGVQLKGKLRAGVTATDLVLHITEVLRRARVVGKFVEFFGEGAASLAVPDRATIANMAPEYGATMGFFPIDEQCCRYLKLTGRSEENAEAFRSYYVAQKLFGVPNEGDIDYSRTLAIALGDVIPCTAGPKRPQDKIPLPEMKKQFHELLRKPRGENGYEVKDPGLTVKVKMGPNGVYPSSPSLTGLDSAYLPMMIAPLTSEKDTNPETEIEMIQNRPTPDRLSSLRNEYFPRLDVELGHGNVVIAAITSCTNTSNPSVMMAAGLVAKKAVDKGMVVPAFVKTSLAPGSRVVTDYLQKTGLQAHLDKLGFQTVGYGCTTCIGNSGPLEPHLEEAVQKADLVVASVLSGNRNFEARVHQSVKANFLMSPPLVIAFALAGRVDIDLDREALGKDMQGNPVFLKDLWPTAEEVHTEIETAIGPEAYRRIYKEATNLSPLWKEIASPQSVLYPWDPKSTYVREPPYFDAFDPKVSSVPRINSARALAVFGDSLTTDHISPAGAIRKDSPAGKYLLEHGVPEKDFNTYGARRGNHEVMVRGTFANVRIRNLMLPDTEGGTTLYYSSAHPQGDRLSIYEAALRYQKDKVPLLIFAGTEYGTGSSRDWAAKGTLLLGVRAVIARSFERIHRNNLVGMGVLPCQFEEGTSAQTLSIDGSETFSILGWDDKTEPGAQLHLRLQRISNEVVDVPIRLRIDTPIEMEYYRNGGILPYMVRQLLKDHPVRND